MALQQQQAFFGQLAELRWVPVAQRVRAYLGDTVVVDSLGARLVSEPRRVVGSYAVPMDDITGRLVDPVAVAPATGTPPVLDPRFPFALHTAAGTSWTIDAAGRRLEGAALTFDDPDLDGYAELDWAAFDRWTEEDEPVISHPHDPFHRIDVLHTDRHVVVTLDGTVLADSRHPLMLLETNLPPRWYLPREDVRMDLLTPSTTQTTCAYKGQASYLSAEVGGRTVEDVAWTYPEPLHDGEPVRDLLAFYPDRVEIAVAS